MAIRLPNLGKLPGQTGSKYQFTQNLTAPGNGEWIIIDKRFIAVILSSTGDGRVEITTGSLTNIQNDTVNAGSIVAWSNGDIGVSIQATNIPECMAIRSVNISGNTDMTVSASE